VARVAIHHATDQVGNVCPASLAKTGVTCDSLAIKMAILDKIVSVLEMERP
jgi:hypothetical protein